MPSIKIGLVSDTHMPHKAKQLPERLTRAFTAEKVGCILHLGDLTTMEVIKLLEALAPVEAVAGNNDGPEIHKRFGRKKILKIGNVRVGMIHGDGSRKTTVERVLRAFAEERVDLVAFGHSHLAYCEKRDGIWLVNPGSPTDKRRSPFYSYAIVDINDDKLKPRLFFFEVNA